MTVVMTGIEYLSLFCFALPSSSCCGRCGYRNEAKPVGRYNVRDDNENDSPDHDYRSDLNRVVTDPLYPF
jgi:hypothetical protein